MRLSNRLLEQQREVIDDRIAPSNLLHELRTRTQHHPPEMLRLSVREQRAEWCNASCVARSSDTVHDNVSFETRFLIVNSMTTQRCDDLCRILVPILGQKPTR